ncbi:MAG: phosphoribosyltransferase family protein, partial [Candidatus Bathyarchaeota archaeon]|nr:phosphoribosyltransferase family protein [Candidatus Bathyarchaeota archaeon]
AKGRLGLHLRDNHSRGGAGAYQKHTLEAARSRLPTLTQPVSVDVVGKRVLVVDEIADTGQSLKLVKEHIVKQGAKEVKIATVYYKPWSIIKPDYYEKETSRWVVFPWEIKETVHKIVKKCKEKGKSLESETAKLVEAGIPKKLVDRFLKEIVGEE